MRALALLSLCLVTVSLEASQDFETKWVTMDDLRSLGITVTAKRQTESVDAWRIDFDLGKLFDQQRYHFTDVVIQRHKVTSALPTSIDMASEGAPVRRLEIKDPQGWFVLNGSERWNAYLAFQYAIIEGPEAGRIVRLLIPVAEIEAVSKEKTANQALQTTPMTRSGFEKTIEFGYPQRGV